MRARCALSFGPALAGFAMLSVCWAPALAVEFTPPANADLPDAIHGPSADRVPPGLACTDNMDFSPEETMSSPFDADLVAFRAHDASRPEAKPAASENCGGHARVEQV